MKKLPYSFWPIGISIAKEFTAQEKQWILEGLALWNKATHHLITFQIHNMSADRLIPIKHQNTVNIVKFTSNHQVVENIDKKENAKIGGYAYTTPKYDIIIIISDRLKDKNQFIKIVLHELGHKLGLAHSIENTAMYPQTDKMTKEVTNYDLWMLLLNFRKIMGPDRQR